MESNELKFLLKLLGCSDYKTLLSASIFDSLKNKTKTCLALAERELVGFSHEITAIGILPPGSALLDMAKEELPLGAKELKLLEKISKAEGKIKPSELNVKKAGERDGILQNLGARGLIEVETSIKRTKAEVWLTEKGQEYLRDEYTCNGTNPAISLDLLNNYISFLRKSPTVKQTTVGTGAASPESPGNSQVSKLSDEEILQTI